MITLANKQKLADWVKEARRMKKSGGGKGGDEGVVALMGKLRFKFLHEVTVPAQIGDKDPAVPVIFMMTTQGIGSGLETSRRIGRGGDLDHSMVHIDASFTAVNWLKVTFSVYDYHGEEMKELCKAFVQTESKAALAAVCANWKKVCLAGNVGEENNGGDIEGFEVKPELLMLDAAAGPSLAVEEAFDYLKGEGRGKVLTCKFHMKACRRRTEGVFLDDELSEKHRDLTDLLLGAESSEEFDKRFSDAMKWYEEELTGRSLRGMQSWLAFWGNQ